MRRSVSRALVLVLCGTVCVSTTAVSSIFSGAPGDRVRTEDRNGDGRPDVWRTYDRRGRLTEVAFDTNFDGRSDVLEYYDQGALVRRETDRNFDGRVDLVESFDRLTHERVRPISSSSSATAGRSIPSGRLQSRPLVVPRGTQAGPAGQRPTWSRWTIRFART